MKNGQLCVIVIEGRVMRVEDHVIYFCIKNNYYGQLFVCFL